MAHRAAFAALRELYRLRGKMKPELLVEFKALYRQQFGESLSDSDALHRATALVNLFRAIYRPIPREKASVYRDFEEWYKEREETHQRP